MTRLRRFALSLAVIAATAAVVPRWWCGREADAWLAGEEATQRALADVVAVRAGRGIRPGDIRTGSEHFDAEWAFVANQMSVLGLGQVVLAHPGARARYLPAMRAALASMLTPAARAFGTRTWGGEDGLSAEALAGSDNGHVYLGYLALAMGMLRRVDAGALSADERALHEALVTALARRLERAPFGMIETFPGVTFPADVASAVGAIGLHARATGSRAHRALLASWAERFRRHAVDPRSGFVYQTLDPRTGQASSVPRGSGTALVVYYLSFADPALARELDRAVALHGLATLLGFGGIREYPPPGAAGGGAGDIDSGPVVLGVSVAASGFGIAGARMFGDAARLRALYRTAYLFGAPAPRGAGGRGFLAGSGLGDAILLAMLTAAPEEQP